MKIAPVCVDDKEVEGAGDTEKGLVESYKMVIVLSKMMLTT